MKIFKYTFFLLLVLSGLSGVSQDIHFSQFNSSPLNANPALTGLFNGRGRWIGNYRNQWNSVTVPFTTFSGSYDGNFKPFKKRPDIVGYGFLFNADQAGDSKLGTMLVAGSLSLTKVLNRRGSLFMTYGLQGGMGQRSFNMEKLQFDSQYQGDYFDPNSPNYENGISSQRIFFFDVTAGANVYFKDRNRFNKKRTLNFGVAIAHINTPNQSFMNDPNARLDRKLTLTASAQYEVSPKMDLIPAAIFLSQGQYRQILAGGHIKYYLAPKTGDDFNTAMYLGLWFRAKDKDAVVISTRFDYQEFNFGISYDVNVSDLTPASHGNGGVEFSIIYLIRNRELDIFRQIPCPSDI